MEKLNLIFTAHTKAKSSDVNRMSAKIDEIITALGQIGNVEVTVDSALSSISTNPVQNKVVNAAINSTKSELTALISTKIQQAIAGIGVADGAWQYKGEIETGDDIPQTARPGYIYYATDEDSIYVVTGNTPDTSIHVYIGNWNMALDKTDAITYENFINYVIAGQAASFANCDTISWSLLTNYGLSDQTGEDAYAVLLSTSNGYAVAFVSKDMEFVKIISTEANHSQNTIRIPASPTNGHEELIDVVTTSTTVPSNVAIATLYGPQISKLNIATVEYVQSRISDAVNDMATKSWVNEQGFIKGDGDEDVATETWVNQQGFLKQANIAALQSSIEGLQSSKIADVRTSNGYIYFFDSTTKATQFDNTGNVSLAMCKLAVSVIAEYGKVTFMFRKYPSGDIFINGNSSYYASFNVRSTVNYEDEVPYDTEINLTLRSVVNGVQTDTLLGVFPANELFSVDISRYVSDGAKVTFIATNGKGNTCSTLQYNVIKATMSMQPLSDTWWANPYINGDSDYGISLVITKNIACKLVATITKNNTTYSTETVDSSSLTSNYKLRFTNPTSNGGGSGVYHIKMQLIPTDSELASVLSETLEGDIICVSQYDTGNYIVINNRNSELKNYSSNRVFDYAVRVGYGTPTVGFVSSVGGVVFNRQDGLTAENGVAKSFTLDMEVSRDYDNEFATNIKTYLDDSLMYNENFSTTNKLGYSAVSGADVLIRMSGRSNNETNPGLQTNLMNNATIGVTYTDVNFTGNDGYQTVIGSDGVTADTSLHIAAGGSADFNLTPLAMNGSEGRTFEIEYKVSNVLDTNAEVIKMYDGSGSSFVGLKVTPTQIGLQTSNHKAYDDQSCSYDGEERTHLTVVVYPNYTPKGGNTSFDACFVYINGTKNRTFAYSRDINVSSHLIIGSENADIDIYSIRTYKAALTPQEVEANTCNWKPTLTEKQSFKAKNNIRDNDGNVDFYMVKSLCNTMVVKTNNDAFPTYGWNTDDTVSATISAYFRDKPSWNWVMTGAKIQGQGTTSMGYFRWNFKCNTNVSITYANGSTTSGAELNFDGGTHKTIKKMCAKINFASSMQSHKIGSVLSYTDLARKCSAIGSSDDRVSIWQYPFAMFQELSDGTYKFIGLYTIGPDKGDNTTFGFTSNSVALEATDNDRLGSNFQVPWNDSTVSVDTTGEKYTICGQNCWEDAIKNKSGVNSAWKPAYNFVYGCSQLIKPFSGTLSQLQSVTDTSYQYWLTSNWNLYFYNPATKNFEYSGINVYDSLSEGGYVDSSVKSLSADAQNEKYKEARRAMFKANVANYFDVQNALFHMAWTEFHAATDNQTKNTYPYMLNVNGSVKWRWREDDMDTIFDIENRGKAYKQYCVEWDDDYSMYGRASSDVWNGRYNQFWVLMKSAFASEYYTYMKSTFIPALHYGTGDNMSSVMKHFQTYYFDNAQNYFGSALYNEAAAYVYELAHITSQNYANKGIALSQSLGDHYSAEMLWVRMRYIYMCSKYMTDLYGVTDSDAFSTRVAAATAGNGNYYTITPAIYVYPVYQSGQQTYRGYRIFPGESRKSYTTEEIATTGDQVVRINGMSYIKSIGSLYKNTLKENITVIGKMLTELMIGTQTDISNIRSNVTSIEISNASALRIVDMSNISTLAGVVDYSSCNGLRELYAKGTNLYQIKLCDGGNLTKLHLPSTINTVSLIGKKKLSELSFAGTDNIETIECVSCSNYATSEILDILTTKYSA